jgi:hypothetical protein
VKLPAFCVEAGRWTRRGKEAARRFASSRDHLPSKDLRLTVRQGSQLGMQGGQVGMQAGQVAMQAGQLGFQGGLASFQGGQLGGYFGLQGGGFRGGQLGYFGLQGGYFGLQGGQLGIQGGWGMGFGQLGFGQHGMQGQLGGQIGMQGGVWAQVSKFQTGLGKRVKSDVRAKDSASSLQLTLEHGKVHEASNAHVKRLAPVIEYKQDVVGLVYAVNGEIKGADIYASNALFHKLWPKLLKAAAVEAVAEAQDGKTFDAVSTETASDFLTEAAAGREAGHVVNRCGCTTMRETKTAVLFDTRDWKQDDVIVRRNILVK